MELSVYSSIASVNHNSAKLFLFQPAIFFETVEKFCISSTIKAIGEKKNK